MNKSKNIMEKAIAAKKQAMKREVEEMQLKAAYYKAKFEIMEYSLKCGSLEKDYEDYVKAEAEKEALAQQEYAKQMEELKNQMGEGQTDGIESGEEEVEQTHEEEV